MTASRAIARMAAANLDTVANDLPGRSESAETIANMSSVGIPIIQTATNSDDEYYPRPGPFRNEDIYEKVCDDCSSISVGSGSVIDDSGSVGSHKACESSSDCRSHPHASHSPVNYRSGYADSVRRQGFITPHHSVTANSSLSSIEGDVHVASGDGASSAAATAGTTPRLVSKPTSRLVLQVSDHYDSMYPLGITTPCSGESVSSLNQNSTPFSLLDGKSTPTPDPQTYAARQFKDTEPTEVSKPLRGSPSVEQPSHKSVPTSQSLSALAKTHSSRPSAETSSSGFLSYFVANGRPLKLTGSVSDSRNSVSQSCGHDSVQENSARFKPLPERNMDELNTLNESENTDMSLTKPFTVANIRTPHYDDQPMMSTTITAIPKLGPPPALPARNEDYHRSVRNLAKYASLPSVTDVGDADSCSKSTSTAEVNVGNSSSHFQLSKTDHEIANGKTRHRDIASASKGQTNRNPEKSMYRSRDASQAASSTYDPSVYGKFSVKYANQCQIQSGKLVQETELGLSGCSSQQASGNHENRREIDIESSGELMTGFETKTLNLDFSISESSVVKKLQSFDQVACPMHDYINQYKWGQSFYEGNSEEMVLAKDKSTNQKLMVKILGRKKELSKPLSRQILLNERRILVKLHEEQASWAISLTKCFSAGLLFCFVFEHENCGTLFDLYQLFADSKAFISEQDLKFIAVEMILALEEIHGLGILHRDVRLSNFFISRRGHIKIANFGLAYTTRNFFHTSCDLEGPQETVTGIVGAVGYQAPEMLVGGTYDGRADYWSAAICLYMLRYHTNPIVSRTAMSQSLTLAPSHSVIRDTLCFAAQTDRESYFHFSSSLERSFFEQVFLEKNSRLGSGTYTTTIDGKVTETLGPTVLNDASEFKRHNWFSGMSWMPLQDQLHDSPMCLTILKINGIPEFKKSSRLQKDLTKALKKTDNACFASYLQTLSWSAV
ncbi:hypothetical protein CANCADRAFT_78370 [Tortispora caseinolytica NRRL Y-17796]|uniref:non-specific serine/threonine protein kinase n=1 Tax=Tortispora caseinolytica NRRL Y-17796 TaxID=767744 RepID=A0A1E4TJG4_9ASCO|nr:hypothetical protein CANCADRAFT_78370 [Tortispora caseinolytica NRRL Y-17796]